MPPSRKLKPLVTSRFDKMIPINDNFSTLTCRVFSSKTDWISWTALLFQALAFYLVSFGLMSLPESLIEQGADLLTRPNHEFVETERQYRRRWNDSDEIDTEYSDTV